MIPANLTWVGGTFFGMDAFELEGTVWLRCKARKEHSCFFSNQPIQPGDMVYRPKTNRKFRWQRVLAAYVEEFAK